MKRHELITSDEYWIVSIEVELWRLAGEPKKGLGKYTTQAKKIFKVLRPILEEILTPTSPT